MNIDSKIFKTGINAGIGAAAVVVTFANDGTYDDFLCGLEDDIYSGAEFMSMMFMMTATNSESVCGSMDKGFEEYNNTCQKYNEAKNKA